MMKKKSVAIFDFDRTITSKDSFIEFLRFTNEYFKLILCALVNSPFILLCLFRLYPRQKLKERFFSFFFKGCLEIALEEKGKDFSMKILPKICYPSAMKVIDWHKRQGHEIYILTASSRIWLSEWCKQNQVILIGTEFETIHGVFTGKIKGKNCVGKEKLNRINFIFENNEIEEVFGYGNDASDKFFLDKVNKPFNRSLNPDNVTRYLSFKV